MNRTQRFEALYAELPNIECKGLCSDSCGPIVMSAFEYDRIRSAVKGPIRPLRHPLDHCPLLADGRCTVYPLRPVICRLWGVTENMQCPFGCVPDRLLTKAEASAFLHRAAVLGGHEAGPALGLLEQMMSEADRRMAKIVGPRRLTERR